MYDLSKLPADFKLRRIAGTYGTVRSAQNGETIKFKYKSGSNPGYRTVLIVNQDNYGFSGICLERDCEWRRFLYKHCDGGHESVEAFVKIENVVKTERKVSVIPQKKYNQVHGIKGENRQTVLTFTNKDGKIFTVETFNDGSVGYVNNGMFESLQSPTEFANDLTKFLS